MGFRMDQVPRHQAGYAGPDVQLLIGPTFFSEISRLASRGDAGRKVARSSQKHEEREFVNHSPIYLCRYLHRTRAID